MKLQAFREGIRDRTQKKRRAFRLSRDTSTYQDILHECAEALVPIITMDEADMFRDQEEDYESLEDYLSRLDMSSAAENFGINLSTALQQAWDKKWNSK